MAFTFFFVVDVKVLSEPKSSVKSMVAFTLGFFFFNEDVAGFFFFVLEKSSPKSTFYSSFYTFYTFSFGFSLISIGFTTFLTTSY